MWGDIRVCVCVGGCVDKRVCVCVYTYVCGGEGGGIECVWGEGGGGIRVCVGGRGGV